MFMCLFLEFKVLYKPKPPPKEVEKDDLFWNPEAQKAGLWLRKGVDSRVRNHFQVPQFPSSVIKPELDVAIRSKFTLGNWPCVFWEELGHETCCHFIGLSFAMLISCKRRNCWASRPFENGNNSVNLTSSSPLKKEPILLLQSTPKVRPV